MALAETTLSSACGASDQKLALTSGASIGPGRVVVIDGEVMRVTKDTAVATTTPGVLRGQDGTPQQAHVSGVRVTHGDAADFSDPAPGVATMLPTAGRALERR